MLKIRKAVVNDVPLILTLFRELATYEREPNAVSATQTDLVRSGFSKRPQFRVIIAHVESKGLLAWSCSFITIPHGRVE